jgi:alcohol dehydrogenase
MDLSEQRLEFVRREMEIPDTILSTGGGDEVETIKELTGGTLAQVVIDATGSNKSMSTALNYTAFHGAAGLRRHYHAGNLLCPSVDA